MPSSCQSACCHTCAGAVCGRRRCPPFLALSLQRRHMIPSMGSRHGCSLQPLEQQADSGAGPWWNVKVKQHHGTHHQSRLAAGARLTAQPSQRVCQRSQSCRVALVAELVKEQPSNRSAGPCRPALVMAGFRQLLHWAVDDGQTSACSRKARCLAFASICGRSGLAHDAAGAAC